jgi:hypothetical protein
MLARRGVRVTGTRIAPGRASLDVLDPGGVLAGHQPVRTFRWRGRHQPSRAIASAVTRSAVMFSRR